MTMQYDIIRRPLVTEKTSIQKEIANQVTFEVDRRANRIEIRRAIDDPGRERLRTVPRRGFVLEMPVSESTETDAGPSATPGRHRWYWAVAALMTLAVGAAQFQHPVTFQRQPWTAV